MSHHVSSNWVSFISLLQIALPVVWILVGSGNDDIK